MIGIGVVLLLYGGALAWLLFNEDRMVYWILILHGNAGNLGTPGGPSTTGSSGISGLVCWRWTTGGTVRARGRRPRRGCMPTLARPGTT